MATQKTFTSFQITAAGVGVFRKAASDTRIGGFSGEDIGCAPSFLGVLLIVAHRCAHAAFWLVPRFAARYSSLVAEAEAAASYGRWTRSLGDHRGAPRRWGFLLWSIFTLASMVIPFSKSVAVIDGYWAFVLVPFWLMLLAVLQCAIRCGKDDVAVFASRILKYAGVVAIADAVLPPSEAFVLLPLTLSFIIFSAVRVYSLSQIIQASQNYPRPARLLAAIETYSLACVILATLATPLMRSFSCTYEYLWAVLALLLPILVLVLRWEMTAPEFQGKAPVRTATRRNSYSGEPQVLGPAVRPVHLQWRDLSARFSRGLASLLRSSKQVVEQVGYARRRDLRTSLAPVDAFSQKLLDRISLVIKTLLARDEERRRSRGASSPKEETCFAKKISWPAFAASGLSKQASREPTKLHASSSFDVAKPVPVGAQGESKFVAEPLGDARG